MPTTANQMAVLDALTDKQREVLIYVSEGLTSKELRLLELASAWAGYRARKSLGSIAVRAHS